MISDTLVKKWRGRCNASNAQRQALAAFPPGTYKVLHGAIGGDCHYWDWIVDKNNLLEIVDCHYGFNLRLFRRVEQTNAAVVIPTGLYEDVNWLASANDWNLNPQLPVRRAEPSPGCKQVIRQPSLNVEHAVKRAGWLLNSEPMAAPRGLIIVTGRLRDDLNCNASSRMHFVFSGENYLGTLTPAPTDWFSSGIERIDESPGGISVTFSFRSQSDPRCCLGHRVTADYAIEGDRVKFVRAGPFVKQ